jgi:hypothetical protein
MAPPDSSYGAHIGCETIVRSKARLLPRVSGDQAESAQARRLRADAEDDLDGIEGQIAGEEG